MPRPTPTPNRAAPAFAGAPPGAAANPAASNVDLSTGRAAPDAVVLTAVRKVYPGSRRRPSLAALDGVSVSIKPGSWVALLGPNGAGKSTLMGVVSGSVRPTSGLAVVMGHPAGSAPAARATGVVFQKPGLDTLLTVRENLRLQAAVAGARSFDPEAAARRLGLADRLGQRVGTLSGGLARRADLARALVGDPGLLLLDEPSAGLDHAARMSFLDLVASVRRDRPATTIIMSTHLMDEADRADRVIMIDRGRIAADGSPTALRAALGDRVVRCRPPLGDAEALLGAAGWDPRRESDGSVTARVGPAGQAAVGGLGSLVARLLDVGAAFEIGPPTLADAYLSATGRELDRGAGDPPPAGGSQAGPAGKAHERHAAGDALPEHPIDLSPRAPRPAGGGAHGSTGAAAAWALARREWTRFLRQPSRLIATLGTALLGWALFASGFADLSVTGAGPGAPGYSAYLLPGMASMVVVFSSMLAGISLIQDRQGGFLQAVLAGAAPRWSLVAAKVMGCGAVAWAQAALLLPGAWVVGLSPGPAGVAGAAAALAMMAAGLIGLSLAAAWWVDSSEGFHGVMNLLLLPMWVLSGSFIVLTGAAAWLRVLMLANPLTWPTGLVRRSLSGTATGDPEWLSWGATIAFAAAGVALAHAAMRRRAVLHGATT